MATPPAVWIIGGGLGLAVAAFALIATRGPTEAEARQFLTRAAIQTRSLPARDGTGAMVAFETARIARIDTAICAHDPDERTRGPAGFGVWRRQSICRYRVATPEGAAFDLVLRASRENAGPADQPTGNPLVDGSSRLVGRHRWSVLGADETARLLAGWTAE